MISCIITRHLIFRRGHLSEKFNLFLISVVTVIRPYTAVSVRHLYGTKSAVYRTVSLALHAGNGPVAVTVDGDRNTGALRLRCASLFVRHFSSN